MNTAKQQIRWKKVATVVGIGALILMIGTTAYDRWRVSLGWCVRFKPDGSQKVMYGDDCWK
ncbi:hypothetical protein [Nostoc sp. UHCC 0252]|uniref:hypothetical protein n=1 Tax=Nostoc sp. UHCC 0252 TaxID=3110241 RepID=UPI002B20DA72|nr:hypothetical protein [Nostoc sp. UHCC 0252]MEA5604999.1 hypothetical protein [Nostoc sp. UHCC 0252]